MSSAAQEIKGIHLFHAIIPLITAFSPMTGITTRTEYTYSSRLHISTASQLAPRKCHCTIAEGSKFTYLHNTGTPQSNIVHSPPLHCNGQIELLTNACTRFAWNAPEQSKCNQWFSKALTIMLHTYGNMSIEHYKQAASHLGYTSPSSDSNLDIRRALKYICWRKCETLLDDQQRPWQYLQPHLVWPLWYKKENKTSMWAKRTQRRKQCVTTQVKDLNGGRHNAEEPQ